MFTSSLYRHLGVVGDDFRTFTAKRQRTNTIEQCVSTAGTHPGTGTWRPSFGKLSFFETMEFRNVF